MFWGKKEERQDEGDQGLLEVVAKYSPHVEFVLGLDGDFLVLTPSCFELTGIDVAELQANPSLLASLMDTDDGLAFSRLMADCAEGPSREAVFSLVSRGGRRRRVLFRDCPAYRPDGSFLGRRGSLVPVDDVAGVAGCREEKIRLLSHFASAVAHDFNNVLGSISVFSQLLQSGCDREEVDDYSTHILAGCRLGQNFTSNLRVFGRPEGSRLENLDLEDKVAEMEELLELIVGDEITVALGPFGDQEPCIARADGRQVEQILINMAVNAREAMPDGGELNISSYRETVAEPRQVASGILPAGEYQVLVVRDSGRGVPDHDRLRIFDPFFTTKQSKTGIGLGLAAAAAIMKSHSGCIDLVGQECAGAQFLLYFVAV